MLGTNDRVAVKFRNREIVVFRSAKGPVALSALCPHEGYRLEDGYSDGLSVRLLTITRHKHAGDAQWCKWWESNPSRRKISVSRLHA